MARSDGSSRMLAGKLGQAKRIADGDLVARDVDQPLVVELVEVPSDDFSHRADRIGKILLRGMNDELVPAPRCRQQQELADEALANREERLLRDVVQELVELTGQLLGAGSGHARIGRQQRPQEVDTQGNDAGRS